MDATLAATTNQKIAEDSGLYADEFDGFEGLYRREYPGLFGVATALVGFDRREDVVQDTMFKALIHWDRVRTLDRPGAWCHRVLVNACRMWWRRMRTERRYLASHAPAAVVVNGPSADVVAFWAAVRELPTRPRMVVALYFAADRSTAEIASILGVPEGTVRSDLTRARAALVTQLRD